MHTWFSPVRYYQVIIDLWIWSQSMGGWRETSATIAAFFGITTSSIPATLIHIALYISLDFIQLHCSTPVELYFIQLPNFSKYQEVFHFPNYFYSLLLWSPLLFIFFSPRIKLVHHTCPNTEDAFPQTGRSGCPRHCIVSILSVSYVHLTGQSKVFIRAMYLTGISCFSKVPFHLPRGRNFTLPEEGSLWSMHPEAASNNAEPLSISLNSCMDETLGLTSSTNAINLYISVVKDGEKKLLE